MLTSIDFNTYVFNENTAKTGIVLSPEVYAFLKKFKKNIFFKKNNYIHTKSLLQKSYIQLNQMGVKLDEETWLLIDENPGDEEGSGECRSKYKIIIKDNEARVFPANNYRLLAPMNKSEPSPARKEQIQYIQSELAKKEECYEQVKAIIEHDEKMYIVVEHDSDTLAAMLRNKEYARQYDFDARIKIALAISTKLLQLEQTNKVHGDLNPDNIRIRRTAAGEFEIFFTKAVPHKDKKTVKTTPYTPPEAKDPTHKIKPTVDRWSFSVILADLFGRSSLSTGIKLPEDVDPSVIDDIRTLLENLHDDNPNNRPSMAFVNQFFTLLTARRKAYQTFVNQWQQVEQAFKTLSTSYTELNSSIGLSWSNVREMPSPKKSTDSLTSYFDQKLERDVLTRLRRLPQSINHYIHIQNMRRPENLGKAYESPFPNLNPVKLEIQQFNASLQISLRNIRRFLTLFNAAKLEETNSSGLMNIRHILNESISYVEKLEKIQQIAAKKRERNFSNWYSRSTIFGKGRHANVEILYEKLAQLTADDPLEENVANIERFIQENNFTH